MTYRVVIEPRAFTQLRIAAQWYRDQSGSDALASIWLDGFLELLQSLKDDPERHGLARESHRFRTAIREVHYGSGRQTTHRAIFRVHRDEVQVLSVRHVAQDDVNPQSL